MKHSMPKALQRRHFLRGLGVSAAAFPLISGLRSLQAQDSGPRKRFITLYTPNGMLYEHWRPPVAIADATQNTVEPLTEELLGASPILAPLAPMYQKLIVPDRLSIGTSRPDTFLGHQKGICSLLTGTQLIGGENTPEDAGLGNGISIDQIMATTMPEHMERPFPSLQLGVLVDKDYSDRHVNKFLSYSGPEQPMYPEDNPFTAFARVFAGLDLQDPEALATLQKRLELRQSVLDHAFEDFAKLNPKLSVQDRQLLESHADSLRSIETRLTELPSVIGGCDTSALENDIVMNEGLDITDLELIPQVGALMTEVAVQAVACDQTRLITFMWTYSETEQRYPWVGVDKGHHAMSHARDADLVAVDNWYAQQYLHMIQRLDAIDDPDGGTLLDNSLVWWANCLSDGSAHHSDNMPFVLAGSLGGHFDTGRYIYYTRPEGTLEVSGGDPAVWSIQEDRYDSDPSSQDLVISIAQGMGMTDLETFGHEPTSHGPLPLLTA